jgi:hypothetical protein
MTGQPQRFTTTSFWVSSFSAIAPQENRHEPASLHRRADCRIDHRAWRDRPDADLFDPRFANFTHGDFLAWGAYLTLTVAGVLGGLAAGLGAPIYPFSFGWGLPLAMFGGVA